MERIKMTAGGREFVFRDPIFEDLIELDESFPLLPVESDLEKEAASDPEEMMTKIAADPKRFRRFLARCSKILVLCSIDPVLVETYPYNADDGRVSVKTIAGQDRIVMGMVLLARGGFDEQSTVEIAPFVDPAESVNTPTPSRSDTAGDLVNTSE